MKAGYPKLTDAHILAALDYARAVVDNEGIYPVTVG